MRNWQTVLTLIIVALALVGVFCIYDYWTLDERIQEQQETIQAKEAEIERAKTMSKMAEAAWRKLKEETNEAEKKMQTHTAELEKKLTERDALINELETINAKLVQEQEAVVDEVNRLANEDLVATVGRALYDKNKKSIFTLDLTTGYFHTNREGAEVIAASLMENAILKKRIQNLTQTLSEERKQRLTMQEVVEEHLQMVAKWKYTAQSAEHAVSEKNRVILKQDSLTKTQKGVIESQNRKLFFYKWGVRIGIGAAIVGAIFAVAR